MAFTYDLTTTRGKVRLQVADTTSTAYVFEDDEVDYAISTGGTVNDATVVLARILLANAALRTKYFSLKGLSFDDRHQVAAIQALIAQYGGLPTLTVTMPEAQPWEDGFVEPTAS